MVRIGLGQMCVVGGDLRGNLDRAAAMIDRAGRSGCHVVVLPECLDAGWTHPSARELARPIPGETSDALAEAARGAGIHVVAGLTERCGEAIYNASVLIDPAGGILLRHRKINELDIAHDLYATGESLAVARTSMGTVGIPICADNFPDNTALGHALARMGARMLLSPSAWAVDADHDNAANPCRAIWIEAYTHLARLYDLVVVGVSNVGWLTAGPWKGRKCIGYSLAVGPGGRIIGEGRYGHDAEELVTVDVEVPPPIARGTGFAAVLRARGYTGP